MRIFRPLYVVLKNLLKRMIADVYREAYEKNIPAELQRRALQSTADYVTRHMASVGSHDSKHGLYQSVLRAGTEPGLWLEFGVFQGESINFLGELTSETVYGFDSFEGLPEAWRDGFPEGYFKVDSLPSVLSNVELVKGWFEDTLPAFLRDKDGEIAVLHVDCDLYSSTKTVLEHCAPRLKVGTIVFFDEYFNYPGWEGGEYKAFQELVQRLGLTYEYLGYVRSHEQVALRITSL